MVSSKLVVDSVDISSGGGTTTSSEVDVEGTSTGVLSVETDSNGTDVDVRLEAKARDQSDDAWAELDSTVSNVDVTSTANNAEIFTYDLGNVVKARFVITNNAGSNTTVSAILGFTEGQ